MSAWDKTSIQQMAQGVAGYQDVQRLASDVEEVVRDLRSLNPKVDSLVKNDGTEVTLMLLCGTIPMFHNQKKYNCPVKFWLGLDYPFSPPICYVSPTRDMGIKPRHVHVDNAGFIYHLYLTQWNVRSSLKELCSTLTAVFSKDPPVYAKVQGGHAASQPVQPQHSSSVPQQQVAQTAQPQSQPPQVAAAHVADLPQPLHPPPSQPLSNQVPTRPPSLPQPLSSQAPSRPPPIPPGVLSLKPDATGYIAAGDFAGSKPGFIFRDGVRGQGYYLDDDMLHCNQQELKKAIEEIAEEAAARPALSAGGSAHASAHAAPSARAGDGGAEDWAAGPQDWAAGPQDWAAGPRSSAAVKQEDESKESLICFVMSKIHAKSEACRRSTESEFDQYQAQQTELEVTQQSLVRAHQALADEKNFLLNLVDKMEEAEAVMSAFLTNVENRRSALGPADSNGTTSVENLVHATDALAQQLMDCVAHDRALEDVLYELDCAMGDGKIETPEYLRLVHKLSRQQFLEKELALKIIGKRRVLGVY